MLVFLDHDDELLPHAVGLLLRLLREFPTAAAAFADHAHSNSLTGQYYPDHHSSQPAFRRLANVLPVASSANGRLYGRSMYYGLLRGNLLQQPWAIRRKVFLGLGGYDESVRLCEDWDLYLRLVKSWEIALSDAVISHHRVHGANLHVAPGQAEMHVKVLKKVAESTGRFDFRAKGIVRRKLAGYYKAWGDAATSAEDARRWHLSSALQWPLDAVVLARVAMPMLSRPARGL